MQPHSRDRGSLRPLPPNADPAVPTLPFRPSRPAGTPSVDAYFKGSSASKLASTSSRPRQSPGVRAPYVNRPTDDISLSRVEERVGKARSMISEEIRWIKGDMIGKGSYGKVYLAFNATSGEIMAVKQVELPTTPSDRMKSSLKNLVDALRSERETLRLLDHENIVQYLGFEENTETVNVFLEYVSGGTIGGCFRKSGRLREDVTKSFTTQILRGLAYLHSKGIIHRDMKSDNILVEETGVCKISDFGISKKLELVDRAHSGLKGTSYWMAPEVLSPGSEGYDSKVDIWSLGCVVLEMWTAKRPWFEEYDIWRVMNKLKNQKTPPLPDDMVLSNMAEHFRRECFIFNAENRPTAERLLEHPYLELDHDWVFPGMQHLGEPQSTISSEAPEITMIHRERGGVHTNHSTVRPSSPALTMQSGTLGVSRVPTSHFAPRPPSPPLVTIAPPPPRRKVNQSSTDAVDWTTLRNRRSSAASESSTSQTSSHSASTQGRRLVIHNPDYVPDFTKEKQKEREIPPVPFVWQPPPLPEVDGLVPYSNFLAPLPAARFPPIPIAGSGSRQGESSSQRRAISSSLQTPPRYNKAGPANMQAAMASNSQSDDNSRDYYSSDSDSNKTSSTWQIRPRSSTGSPRQAAPSSPEADTTPTRARQRGHKRISSIAKDSRPNNLKVLADLGTYFPEHNLDVPVVQTPVEPEFQPNRARLVPRHSVLKSFKAIAAEKVLKDAVTPLRRQQTRLWDSHIEEIKPPRPT